MSPNNKRAPEYMEADQEVTLRTAISTPRARQGVTGHNVRYVLGFGLVAVVAAFLIVYLVYFG